MFVVPSCHHRLLWRWVALFAEVMVPIFGVLASPFGIIHWFVLGGAGCCVRLDASPPVLGLLRFLGGLRRWLAVTLPVDPVQNLVGEFCSIGCTVSVLAVCLWLCGCSLPVGQGWSRHL